ncbi:MAG: spermidine/putrescine ABC transporter substrate-binding protein [Ruminococcaceae bacterium]|nr:spermidine/putrescine ABC transporter substrate-binding protein [Oscillospiraceae bacterium]
MKRILSSLLLLSLVLSLVAVFLPSCGGGDVIVLNVYNWGEYISDGSEGTLDVNAAFEEYYYETYGQKIKVNYTTYASNEDMYAKLRSGSASYDVIIPSDYMIQRMIDEGMLEKLNLSNIPNAQYIAPEFRGQYYDPNNEYSVPYTCGMVGIIYNTNMVDEEDIGSWDILWNDKYSGKILQFNNARDAFGTAMYYQQMDVNTKNRADWEAALQLLKDQKPIVQGYVMDEVFNKMKGESAAIAPYYAGDYLTMYDSNDALAFYYPEEGTNIFVDAMCIPTGSRNKDAAEAYINFMLSEEIAVANAEYIGYASPNLLVRENEEYIEYMEDWHEDAMSILYYDAESVPTQYYHMLDVDTQNVANELWEQLKIESSVGSSIHTIALVIVILCAAFFLWRFILKKYRTSQY